jgi:Glycosyltransferase family 9 (heptosyltransferase)
MRIELTGRPSNSPRKSPEPLQPTVFFFCRLGDMIMLTRLLNVLRQRYGRPCQVIGTGSWTSGVYEGNPDVTDVWSFHRHLPFVFERHWSSVRRALRDSHPGPIYICERHYRQLPRIRRMLRFSGVDLRRCVFLTDEPITGPEHLVDRLTRLGNRTPALLDPTDYPLPQPHAIDGPRVYVLDSERAERDAWLKERGWLGREIVMIQPGNHRSMGPRRKRWRRLNTDDKWWPLECWAELMQRVHEHKKDALILLRGTVEEVPMLAEIQAVSKLKEVVVDGHGLRRLFSLSAGAHSMISVDTGPAHAAAALSLPLVVLYGAENAKYWLPRSPSGSPVIGVGGPPMSVRADQVSVDTVFEAWLELTRQLESVNAIRTAAPLRV